jgi:hypothetical protein
LLYLFELRVFGKGTLYHVFSLTDLQKLLLEKNLFLKVQNRSLKKYRLQE